ncbi:GNAT family N-acetyltransferase [Haloplanus salilacus]|uniref:GNAT family N-acetyltransferase n=1 Tax=Haloplanus salilacus TaxID=2949994 RepID=UPI0030D4D9A5
MIRPATPDEERTLALLQSQLREPSPGLLDAWASDAVPSPAEVLVSTTEADRPVGYLLAVPGDGTAYVAELVVAPDHRREGRATALLSAYAESVEGGVTVTVAAKNAAARALYRGCGFERVWRLPDFFDAGDAILYRRG